MQSRTGKKIAGTSLVIIILAELLPAAGMIPPWAGFILLVLSVPWFLLGLMLWWRAPGGESDLPFIGY